MVVIDSAAVYEYLVNANVGRCINKSFCCSNSHFIFVTYDIHVFSLKKVKLVTFNLKLPCLKNTVGQEWYNE